MMMLLILVFVCGFVLWFYVSMAYKFKYFRKRGLQGPEPRIPFGNTPSAILQNRNPAYDIDDIYK